MDFNDISSLLSDILDDKPVATITPPIVEPKTPETVVADTDLIAEAAVYMDKPTEVRLASLMQEEETHLLADHNATVEPEAATVATPAIFTDSADRTEPDIAIPMPTFTSEEVAAALDLRNFATLVTLNTARWHAKVKDRQASIDIATANNADAGAFESRKRLLAGADEKLKRIHKAIDNARAKHYEMTLPWTTTGIQDLGRRSGGRMLPNTLFFDYTKAMAEAKAEMKAAVEDFVPDYPALINQAEKKLGKRFDRTEYPNQDSIAQHFDLSFDFQPIPQGQDFKGLPQQQCDALARAIADKTNTMVENAMHDLWVRLHEAVSHMAERLSDPDKMFHHTLVQNVRTTARLLKHLNITGDTRIEELRKYVEQHLCPHETEDLRTKPVIRSTTAAHARTVLDMMAKVAGHAS